MQPDDRRERERGRERERQRALVEATAPLAPAGREQPGADRERGGARRAGESPSASPAETSE